MLLKSHVGSLKKKLSNENRSEREKSPVHLLKELLFAVQVYAYLPGYRAEGVGTPHVTLIKYGMLLCESRPRRRSVFQNN